VPRGSRRWQAWRCGALRSNIFSLAHAHRDHQLDARFSRWSLPFEASTVAEGPDGAAQSAILKKHWTPVRVGTYARPITNIAHGDRSSCRVAWLLPSSSQQQPEQSAAGSQPGRFGRSGKKRSLREGKAGGSHAQSTALGAAIGAGMVGEAATGKREIHLAAGSDLTFKLSQPASFTVTVSRQEWAGRTRRPKILGCKRSPPPCVAAFRPGKGGRKSLSSCRRSPAPQPAPSGPPSRRGAATGAARGSKRKP
jgi:hypothetical protein